MEEVKFKRFADPHGCPERSHIHALGTVMHCRLDPHGDGIPHVMEVSGPYVLEHDTAPKPSCVVEKP